MKQSAGYSGTPLAKKLGIKSGYSMLLVNGPKHYFDLFSDFPQEVNTKPKLENESLDFVHIFATTPSELESAAKGAKPFLKKSGILWVSWPKGSSKIPSELKREPVREHLLKTGLVDIKVCAVDENWSGLKFMYRKEDR